MYGLAVLAAALHPADKPVTTNARRNSIGRSEAAMFNPTKIVIQAFVEQLQGMYRQIYGVLEPAYPDIIAFVRLRAMPISCSVWRRISLLPICRRPIV